MQLFGSFILEDRFRMELKRHRASLHGISRQHFVSVCHGNQHSDLIKLPSL